MKKLGIIILPDEKRKQDYQDDLARLLSSIEKQLIFPWQRNIKIFCDKTESTPLRRLKPKGCEVVTINTQESISEVISQALPSLNTKFLLILKSSDRLYPKTLWYCLRSIKKTKTQIGLLKKFTDRQDKVKIEKKSSKMLSWKSEKEKIQYDKFLDLRLNELVFDTTLVSNLEKVKCEAFDEQLLVAKIFSNQPVPAIVSKGGIIESDHEKKAPFFRLLSYWQELQEYFLQLDKLAKESLYTKHLMFKEIAYLYKESYFFLTEDQKAETFKKFLIDALKEIPDKVILRYPGVERLYKYELLDIKHEQLAVVETKDSLSYRVDNVEVGKESEFETVISDLVYKDGYLELYGYLQFPLQKKMAVSLNLSGNEELYEVELHESAFSYFKSRFKTTELKGFRIKVNINKIVNNEVIQFFVEINETHTYLSKKITIQGNRIFSMNDVGNEFAIDHHLLKINKNSLEIERISEDKETSLRLNYLKILENNNLLSYTVYEKEKKAIWLYADNQQVTDNSFLQFLHDIKKEDGIQRYYICGESQNIRNDLVKPYLVVKGSEKHKKLFIEAEKIFVSFLDASYYNPFNKKQSNLLSSFQQYSLIYFGHGVLHANLIRLYAREKTKFDYFIVSSKFEESALVNNYHYSKNQVLRLGQPRFERELIEVPEHDKIKHILFAPTWRAKLSKGFYAGKWLIDPNEIQKTEYFVQIKKLLTDKQLHEYLVENSVVIDLKLHPIFSEVTHLFSNLPNIHVVTEIMDNRRYDCFVTDYSSFVFDFVRENIPVIYYLVDDWWFQMGNHSYNQLLLNFDEAFGKVCETPNQFLRALSAIDKNNWKAEKKYEERMGKFFDFPENNREKIYTFFINN